MTNLKRRNFLVMLACLACFAATPAFAEDDDSDGGSSGSGSSESEHRDSDSEGSDDRGSDNSGSGSDDSGDDRSENSGSGRIRDGDDDDDDRNSTKQEQERALNAVSQGKAVPLRNLRVFLERNYPGRLLSVGLQRKSGTYFYTVRILSAGNRITTLRLNALTLRPRTS